VLGGAGGLARDEPDVIAGHDIDHGAADALCAGIALVALLGGAEEKRAVLVDPDVAWPLLPKAQLTGPSAVGVAPAPSWPVPRVLDSAPQCGDQEQDPDRPYLQRPDTQRPGQQPGVSLRPQPGDDPPHEPEVHGQVDEV
jgi:hypothetical protein